LFLDKINFIGKNMKNKYTKISYYLILIVTVSSIIIYANSTGKTGSTLKNGSGCTCHGSQSTNVNVIINGPATVEPGKTENFTVTVTGGPLSAAGVNIAASGGVLNVRPGLQKIGDELTHTLPKNPTSGSVSFEFQFTAPTTLGNVTLYATANSVNLNGGSSGDQWNHASNKIINVSNPSDIKDDLLVKNFILNQNFPNPFNPKTTVSYQLAKSSFVTLKVYNSIGKEVADLINKEQSPGYYSIDFNSENFSSGVYYYKLKAGNFSETRKMILNK
jgi:hypothetical protein